MSGGYSVVLIGGVSVDETVQEHGTTRQLGGVVTYAGLTYRQAHLSTHIVTRLAESDVRILGALVDEGIEVVAGPSRDTTRFIDHVDGDARWEEIVKRAAPITLGGAADELVERADFIHLGPLHPFDIDSAVFEACGRSGVRVALDLQGYTRQLDGRRVSRSVSGPLEAALACSSVVKANAEELETILSYYGTKTERFMQCWSLSECIVTDGSRGGHVVVSDGGTVVYRAGCVDKVMDPTGAGDVFFAAYLIGRYVQGLQPEASSEEAAAVAARHVAGRFISREVLSLPATS